MGDGVAVDCYEVDQAITILFLLSLLPLLLPLPHIFLLLPQNPPIDPIGLLPLLLQIPQRSHTNPNILLHKIRRILYNFLIRDESDPDLKFFNASILQGEAVGWVGWI